MPSVQFKNWLKSTTNIRLSSDRAVNRLIAEGIVNFASLLDLDKKSVEALPSVCKETIPAVAADVNNGIAAEAAVNGANITSISVRRLIVAVNAAYYYHSIGRTLDHRCLHYDNVLSKFKTEWDNYQTLRDLDEPDVPLVNDRDNDRKIIKWAPVFLDCLSRTYGARGPLSYVLREVAAVPAEADDKLANNSYFGKSGSLHDELVARLPHSGPIYKSDNKSVYIKIEKATRGTSVESTVKAFSRLKDSCAAFEALLADHVGEVKYPAILKRRMNILRDVKWNGCAYPLEAHVSNHCQAVDDIH